MRNTSLIICHCLVLSGLAFAQEPSQTPLPADGHSESKVYSPTVFPDLEKKKKTRKFKRTGTPTDMECSIPVSVFANTGARIADIKREEIQLFVDGSEVTDFELERETGPLNVLVLVDRSPSMSHKIEEIRDFLSSFVRSLSPDDKVWVADFDIRYRLRSSPSDTREEMFKRISILKLGNGTSLYDSIVQVLDSEFSEVKGNKAVVVIADGVDTSSRKTNYDVSLLNVETHEIPFYPVYLDTEGKFDLGRYGQTRATIVAGSVPGALFPLPGPAPGTSKAEYAIGRLYLDDLVRITGGRAFEYGVVSQSDKALEYLAKNGIRPDYRLKFTVAESVPLGKRLGIKVRVKRADLVVTSRGSFIRD